MALNFDVKSKAYTLFAQKYEEKERKKQQNSKTTITEKQRKIEQNV